MIKRLSEITEGINILERRGPDPEITGIYYDSRKVIPGGVFAATGGIHTDGHKFIKDALDRGASAIIHSKTLDSYKGDIAYIRTNNPRLALSPLSAAYYGRPGDKLKLIGVTGTDGKTSTVFLIHQLLELAGFNSGFISTATYQAGGNVEKNPYRQSTPEAPEVHGILAKMVDSGCEFGVIEATSHGLSPLTGRLADVPFSAGVFTNITHEHLEFHGTFENYRKDKARLFKKVASFGSGGFSVLNSDASSWEFMKKASGEKVFTYSIKNGEADLFCSEIDPDQEGSDVRLTGNNLDERVRINLPGSFNVENIMAALLTVGNITGKSVKELLPYIPKLAGVKGRMRKVEMGQPFTVIVDYAHTPGAFEKLLPSVRETTPGKVIALFGSAGERDQDKRPMQGEIAARYCDILILTDEDPRGENPEKILAEIARGAFAVLKEKTGNGDSIFQIPSRTGAIDKAFSLAEKGDTVLLLGKGHETSIIYPSGPEAWDEEKIASERLAHLGFKG